MKDFMEMRVQLEEARQALEDIKPISWAGFGTRWATFNDIRQLKNTLNKTIAGLQFCLEELDALK